MNVGDEFGPSEWLEIDAGADRPLRGGDRRPQWIHVDPEQAAEGPFGTTIAHGFLTLSLLVRFWYEVGPTFDELLDGDQLRPEQGALPGAGTGRQHAFAAASRSRRSRRSRAASRSSSTGSPSARARRSPSAPPSSSSASTAEPTSAAPHARWRGLQAPERSRARRRPGSAPGRRAAVELTLSADAERRSRIHGDDPDRRHAWTRRVTSAAWSALRRRCRPAAAKSVFEDVAGSSVTGSAPSAQDVDPVLLVSQPRRRSRASRRAERAGFVDARLVVDDTSVSVGRLSTLTVRQST